jgi:hypothetical protein
MGALLDVCAKVILSNDSATASRCMATVANYVKKISEVKPNLH